MIDTTLHRLGVSQEGLDHIRLDEKDGIGEPVAQLSDRHAKGQIE